MSQKRTEFIKKVEFQINKTFNSTITEKEKINIVNNLLNSSINTGDIIVDSEMPHSMIGIDIDWEAGNVNDLLIRLFSPSEMRYSIYQDLSLESSTFIPSFSDDFKFKITTSSSNESFTFPSNSSYIIDAIIDWGDGTSSDITSWDSPDLTHTYTNIGGYNITVTGACEYFDMTSNIQIRELNEMKSARFLKVVSFQSCTNLASIDSTWKKINRLETAEYMFKNCNLLTSIPIGLFDNSTSITNFMSTFYGCSNLTSIPSGLFDNNTEATNFMSTFYGCSNLTSIPSGLFDNNTKATSFMNTFYGCSNLTSLPSGLFDNNTEATSFMNTFYGCSITSIPSGLFDNNTEATDFRGTFKDCSNLTSIPANFLYYNVNIEKVSEMFENCIGIVTSVTGSGNFISQVETNVSNNGSIVLQKQSCFNGCTSISDYQWIPIGTSDWRTI